METLVILDYNTASVDVYNVDSEANIDDRYIDSLGHNPDECSWMFAENLKIQFNSTVLK